MHDARPWTAHQAHPPLDQRSDTAMKTAIIPLPRARSILSTPPRPAAETRRVAIREDDVVRWPYGAAETAPIDERDVAAVAARARYEDGHAGGDYVLTGPESPSQAGQVRLIGGVLGRRIRFEELSPEEVRRETAGTCPVRSWRCCSPRGVRRSDARRS